MALFIGSRASLHVYGYLNKNKVPGKIDLSGDKEFPNWYYQFHFERAVLYAIIGPFLTFLMVYSAIKEIYN